MTNLTIRHVCNDNATVRISHLNVVAWQGRDADHGDNTSFHSNLSMVQDASCSLFCDGNVTGGDKNEDDKEVTNMTSGDSVAGNIVTTNKLY